uniref:Trans-2,3-enoyl-CoA reductase n=1 Tax=Sus scrofa TaxID=9823 RepID=A0A5G2RGJ8_PIG
MAVGPLGLHLHRSRQCQGRHGLLSSTVEILDAKTREKLCFLDKVGSWSVHCDISFPTDPQWYPARQSLRLDPKGKSLKDEDVLQKLPVGTTATLYFRDLGAQISWVTVFLTEYAGPLFIYLLFYFRVPFIYGHKYDFTSSRHTVVHLACICHSFHYIKRLLETLFVHRFSHGTMPLRNIFKNCTYYWGFAAWMAYYINHPLYTPPTYGAQQVKLALAIFVICQLGNFSIHMALRDLRPAGSKTRKIPYPTKNPFTWLFLLVSCPNYTYEVGSWIGFAIMTQCLPGEPAAPSPGGACLPWLCAALPDSTALPYSGPLLPGGLHPDDHLGQGQAPQLPEGVPRLPAPTHAHHPLPALSGSPHSGSGKLGSVPLPRPSVILGEGWELLLSSAWNKTCLPSWTQTQGVSFGGWFRDQHTTERGRVWAKGPGGFYFLTGPQGGRWAHYRAISGATSPGPWPLAISASLCSRRFFRWSSRRSRSNSFMRFT